MICDIYKMSVLLRESYRITLYIHLRLVQNWRFVWEGLQYPPEAVLSDSWVTSGARCRAQAGEKECMVGVEASTGCAVGWGWGDNLNQHCLTDCHSLSSNLL